MTRKVSVLLALLIGLFAYAQAQDDNSLKITSKPDDMWEVGIHLGHNFLSGDVDWNSNFGVGLHLRKSIDYVFSIRLDAGYYAMGGEEDENRRPADAAVYGFASNWMPDYSASALAGDINAVISLNQMKVGRTGKINPYVFLGAGLASLNSTVTDGTREVDVFSDRFDDNWNISTYLDGGAGIGFKIADKISLSIEHKVTRFLGRRDDLVDGVEFRGFNSITSEADLMNYTNVRLGIALGDSNEKSAPLWWASPLDLMVEDLAEVKARPKLDLTDTDGDGIIDMIDQEVNSPGTPVDTRGVSLDSDGDGIADYKDKEPYSPPGYKIDSEGVAQIPEPDLLDEGDVNRIVDAKIAAIDIPQPQPLDWFLPMINFDNNSYAVKNSEYSKLHQVATVLKNNPSVRVLVKGYTDKTAGNCYNDLLSYNRAQAAIDYLVSKYGADRSRLVLNWGGENDTLVPTNGKSLINRRVEFSVAQGESEMGRPDCGVNKAGRGGSSYSGNKEAGY